MRGTIILLGTAAIFAAGFLLVGSPVSAGNEKVEICHLPPGNPDNFHTITVSTNAVPAHMAHGDLLGSCSANCDELCDDGNACTQDCADAETVTCYGEERPPVDCGDGLGCTIDSCDPAVGCGNEPVTCDAPDLCTVSMCIEPDGLCADMPVVCPEGQECELATGNCVTVMPACPCWDSVEQLREIWAGFGIEATGCDTGLDLCRDLAPPDFPFIFTQAFCQSSSGTFFTSVSTSSDRPRCGNSYDGVTDLDPDELLACLEIHDAFTATTEFPNERDLDCGLPDPQ